MLEDVPTGWASRRWTVEPAGRPALALADLTRALALWPLWVRLGWHDILYRYRRSLLGPFWFTLNTAALVVALGIVYSRILHVPASRLMPFLCAGLLIWNFCSAMLVGAGEVFCGAESYIKQVRLPYLLHVFRFVFGKLLILAHDVPILIVLMAWFGIRPGLTTLLALPGLLLLLLNGVLVSVTLALVSARFRDIPRILASVTQLLFLITPILWLPELLGERSYIAYGNPFFHLVEVVRAPLLGSVPAATTVAVTLAVSVLNLALAAFLFVRYRARIAYWL